MTKSDLIIRNESLLPVLQTATSDKVLYSYMTIVSKGYSIYEDRTAAIESGLDKAIADLEKSYGILKSGAKKAFLALNPNGSNADYSAWFGTLKQTIYDQVVKVNTLLQELPTRGDGEGATQDYEIPFDGTTVMSSVITDNANVKTLANVMIGKQTVADAIQEAIGNRSVLADKVEVTNYLVGKALRRKVLDIFALPKNPEAKPRGRKPQNATTEGTTESQTDVTTEESETTED